MSVTKKYGRKKKDVNERREVVTEPTRRSIYDVLQTNLKLAKRTVFIHRLLYIGEHRFEQGIITEAMEENYRLTNTGYCTEPLSGILLHYTHYFCYIVEGSEEALNKHLSLLFRYEDENISNVRLLAAVHHVKGRFWNEWLSYHGRPPERVEDIDPESNLENSMRYATECCEKLYKFANAYISQQMRLRRISEHTTEGVEEEEEPDPRERPKSRSFVERDIYYENLPEKKLLNFLCTCKYLKTLKQYYQYYEYIGQSQDYSLKSWPAPKNFVPYDIFDERYDPITNLPPQKGQESAPKELEPESEAASAVVTIAETLE